MRGLDKLFVLHFSISPWRHGSSRRYMVGTNLTFEFLYLLFVGRRRGAVYLYDIQSRQPNHWLAKYNTIIGSSDHEKLEYGSDFVNDAPLVLLFGDLAAAWSFESCMRTSSCSLATREIFELVREWNTLSELCQSRVSIVQRWWAKASWNLSYGVPVTNHFVGT